MAKQQYSYYTRSIPSTARNKRLGDSIQAVSGGSLGGIQVGGGQVTIQADFDMVEGEGILIDKNTEGNLVYTISHKDTSAVESILKANKQAIAGVGLDGFGHVIGLETCEILTLEELDKRYLRKDISDTAHGIISFDKEVKSSIFFDGYDGKGWEINSNGTAWLDAIQVRSDIFVGNKFGSPSFAPGFAGWGHEIDTPTATGTFDNIFVRKNFTAYTLTYSQIFGLGGSQIVSDINKIGRVETMQDRFRCYIDSMDGLMLMNFRVGDGVRIQMRTGTTSLKYLFGRVINVTSEYFDIAKPLLGGEGEPEAGDFALRWGNDRDQTRQGLIYLTTADQGSPFLAIYDGVTSESTEDTLKVQLGNLSGIRTTQGVQLSGYGGYFNGIYIENSSVVLTNGMTVEQQFMVMNGEFNSKIEGVRNDMSLEKGNILRNSSFAVNTYFWESENDIHFVNVNGAFLWLGGDFYTEKDKVADIYRDGSKNVLRVKHTSIKQKNEYFNVESSIEAEGTYSFSLYCKVVEPGTLTVGFTGTELFLQQQLAPTENYQKLSHMGTWNGKGDFSISFTGEVLVYGVSLFHDALSDAVIKLQTKIFQNEEMIKLSATKDYVDKATGAIYVKYDSELTVMADDISARVTRQDFDTVTGQIERDLTSKIEVQAGSIAAISSDVNTIQHTINTAGWINSTQGNLLFASKTLEDGQKIIDYINQTPGRTTISSSRIDLYGAVTFSMFDSNLARDFNGKANSSSLRSLAYLDKVEEAQLGETIIQGGYLKTTLINTEAIYANMVKVGAFTINSSNGLTWTGLDYFGGQEFSLVLGTYRPPIHREMPSVIYANNSSGRVTAAVAGFVDGMGCGIYGSADGWGSSIPSSDFRFAGFFSGNVKVTGEFQAREVVGREFRFAYDNVEGGAYRYDKGISFDPASYDLDKVRFRVRGGLIIGVTDDNGKILQGV